MQELKKEWESPVLEELLLTKTEGGWIENAFESSTGVWS